MVAFQEILRPRRKAHAPITSELQDSWRDNDGTLVEKPFNPGLEVERVSAASAFWHDFRTSVADGQRTEFFWWVPGHAGILALGVHLIDISTEDRERSFRLFINDGEVITDPPLTWDFPGFPDPLEGPIIAFIETDVEALRGTHIKVQFQVQSDLATGTAMRTDVKDAGITGSLVDPLTMTHYRAKGATPKRQGFVRNSFD
ncbi:hypothetical protein LCGC14_0427510 [marine sediment metagenome]|uniref:Uncharacterized protein n=1 Tax=marine sediment metagenome TaxID=412755 RepID=A0A0F9VB19_9ZZZZ